MVCGLLSNCNTQALEHAAQSLWHTDLVALWHVRSRFLDQILNPCSLHWRVDS